MDAMGRHEKNKILLISDDLLKDAMLKMRQVFGVREEHEAYIAYHVGVIMGRIREKYRFMGEIYREIYDKSNSRSTLSPPGVAHLKTLHFIIALEMVHYLGTEIDKLLTVLEDTAMEDIHSNNLLIDQPMPKKKTRTGPERTELREKAMQEAAKSMLRQQYLMKKMGQPVNMTTTKKRFLRQWPVQDTWSLEKYNYY
uniref:Uncharacterized protein n=1 Tax=Heliothis virescens TaxID=7102 RepID=A0A2A4JMH7_HELVI